MLRVLFALVLSAWCSSSAWATTYYLSPSGDDLDDGLSKYDSGATGPWLTFTKALGASGIGSGDTLICLDGEWSGGNEPFNVDANLAGAGTPGAWTHIIADTNATPIFDATGQISEGYALRWNSSSSPARERIVIRGLTFQDYPDLTGGTSSGGTGTLQFQVSGSTAATGFHVQNCTFEREDADTVDTAVGAFTNSADPSTDVIDSLIIEGCRMIGLGNVGIYLGRTPRAIIRGNIINRPLEYNQHRPSSDGPNGILVSRYFITGLVIEDNIISGWDHGAEVRGTDGIFRRNIIHDLSDDFLWVHWGVLAYPAERWLIEDNICYWGQDEGFEIQGKDHVIRHNTVVRNGNWLIALSDGVSGAGGAPENTRVESNIFLNSQGLTGESTGDQAVFLASGHSGNLILKNIFFDPDGTLEVDDQDDGTVLTIADLNGEAYGSGNWELYPTLIDTTGAASKPYFSGVNLRPAVNSWIHGVGQNGRTPGAYPCGGCGAAALNVTGFDPDSVHLSLYEQLGALERFLIDAALVQSSPRSWLHPILADSNETYELRAVWSAFDDGDSLTIEERITVLVDPPALAAFAADSAWSPTSAAWRWRTIHRADSSAWYAGSGAFNGTIVTRDASSLNRIPFANVRVFSDVARTQRIGNLTTSNNGEVGYAYASGANYYFTGWATGYQTFDVTYKPLSDGFTFNIDLSAINAPITTDPQLCTVSISTADFQGLPVDSILVEANFEGRGADTGDLILSYSSVNCATDAGGFCSMDLVRSSEISTPDRIKSYVFTMTDQRSPALFAPITFRSIEIPDQASANLVDLLP